MKMFAKLFTLGLLLVTLPVVARSSEKCFGNVYNGIIADTDDNQDGITIQLFDDHTMLLQSRSGFNYQGTWKCSGSCCFTFCATSNRGAEEFQVFEGTICFTKECEASISNLTLTAYSDPELKTVVGTPTEFEVTRLTLQSCN